MTSMLNMNVDGTSMSTSTSRPEVSKPGTASSEGRLRYGLYWKKNWCLMPSASRSHEG